MDDKVFMKGIVCIVISIAICMMIASVVSSVSNYHLTIEAMKNGYIQQKVSAYSNQLIWVKEDEKQKN